MAKTRSFGMYSIKEKRVMKKTSSEKIKIRKSLMNCSVKAINVNYIHPKTTSTKKDAKKKYI